MYQNEIKDYEKSLYSRSSFYQHTAGRGLQKERRAISGRNGKCNGGYKCVYNVDRRSARRYSGDSLLRNIQLRRRQNRWLSRANGTADEARGRQFESRKRRRNQPRIPLENL